MTKKAYPYYSENVNVNDLIIDDDNPRLPEYLHGKSEEKVIEHMLLSESTLELMQAIGKKGFFKGELLLVVEENNKYKVIEGNRRLISVKLLNNPKLATAQESLVQKIHKQADQTILPIKTLPCMVFEGRRDIVDYLGYRHVTGIQPWNLRQKAKYLSDLRHAKYSNYSLDDASDELRKIIGSKKNVIKRYLVGHEIYLIIKGKKFFRIQDLEEESFYFSYISDSLRRTHIAKYLGVDMESKNPTKNLDINHLRNWTEWLFKPLEGTSNRRKKTMLRGSEDLNKLNAILENDIAREYFIEKSATLDEAHSYTEDVDIQLRITITDSRDSMNKAMRLTHKVNKFYSTLDEDLREIIRISRNIKLNKDISTNEEFRGHEFG